MKPEEHYCLIALLWPFTLNVWILICFSVVLGLFFLIIFSRVLVTFTSSNTNTTTWFPKSQLLFLVSVFIEHDIPRFKSTSSSLRIFSVFWLFFGVVITSAYRSKLAALWTFPIFNQIPQTLHELVNSPDYKIGFMKHGNAAYNAITISTDPTYVKLVTSMKIFEGKNDVKCLENVFKINDKYKYVCIGYSFALKYLKEKDFSDRENRKIIFLDEEKNYIIFLGIATQPGSVYSQLFGKYLGYVQQFDLYNVWNRMDMYYNVKLPKLNLWRVIQGNKTEKRDDSDKYAMIYNNNLTMRQIIGVVYIFIFGIFISMVIYICERIYKAIKIMCCFI